jgi:hypothetical protein
VKSPIETAALGAIPVAKLHRLALTDAEVQLLIRAISYSIGTSGKVLALGRLLAVRSQLERSQPT